MVIATLNIDITKLKTQQYGKDRESETWTCPCAWVERGSGGGGDGEESEGLIFHGGRQ